MANNQLKEELLLNTSGFDGKIESVIKKVEELKNKGSRVGDGFDGSLGKLIQRATGFNGSLTSLVGVVGKLSGALGLAMGASEAFNKTINSSQTLADEYGSIQQSVNTIVDDFFQSLANGDFSPFLNGIGNLIDKAKEAYNAMDDLWNMSQSFSVQNARLNNQFQQNLNEIRSKKDSTNPNDKKRVKELTDENKKIIEQQAQGGIKLYKQTIKGLQDEIAAGTGINVRVSESAIYKIVENDINNLKGGRKRYAKEYGNYLNEVEKLNKKADKDFKNGGMGRYGVNYSNDLNKLQSKYGEAIAANYLLQKKSDEELKDFNDKLKQGIQYQGVAIANQSKMLRYTKENTKETTKQNTSNTKTTKTHVAAYNEQAKTVGEIKDNITVLTKQLDKCTPNSEEYEKVSEEIKKWKELIDKTPKPTLVQNATVIKDIENNISILQTKLQGTVKGSKEWLEITKQIKDETAKLNDYQVGSLADLQHQISEIEDKLGKENLSLKTRLELIDKKAELQNKINSISDDAYIKVTPITGDLGRKSRSVQNASTNIGNIQENYANGLIDYTTAKKEIEAINNELVKIGATPITVHIESDAEKQFASFKSQAELVVGAFGSIDGIVGSLQSLGNALNEDANAWEIFMGALNVGMSIIEGVGTILSMVNTLQNLFGATSVATAASTQIAAAATTEKAAVDTASVGTSTAAAAAAKVQEAALLDLAAAEIFAAHAAVPFAGVGIANGFITEMLATMSATAASTKLLAAFANGGIVGGNSFVGDSVLVRANSGEMILTSQQQKHLFDLLDMGATNGVSGGQVEFKIRGGDLYGALKNYSSVKSKTSSISRFI